MKSLKKDLANKVAAAVERNGWPWECVILGMAEPEMPEELLLEEME